MNQLHPNHRADLAQIARQPMIDRGLEPEFSTTIEKEITGGQMYVERPPK